MRIRSISFALLLVMASAVGAQPPPPVPEGTTGPVLAPLPPAAAPAQPATPRPADAPPPVAGGMTLAELEQMALANNPTLSQFRARVQAARGTWVQAGLYPNPMAGYMAEEIGAMGKAGMQGAFVGQEFVTAGKLQLGRAVASQEVAQAEREYVAQQYRVLTDVRIVFFRAAVAQQRVALAEQLVQVAEHSLEAATALYQAQETSQIAVLQTRIQLNSTRILLHNARSEGQAAWQTLAAVVGCPDLPVRPLAGAVEPGRDIAFAEALQTIVCTSPELAAAWSGMERAKWAVQQAQAEVYPNIETEANVLRDTASGETVAGVQVGVALPIFNRNQGNIIRAQAQVAEASRNVDRVRLALQSRLAETYRRYEEARHQVDQYRQSIIPDAQAALELVVIAYQQGEVGYLDLLGAQRSYFQSNLAYLDSLLELKAAEMAIEGLLLSGSLEGEGVAMPASEAPELGTTGGMNGE